MKINFNGKQTLVIAVSAATMGAAIFGIDRVVNRIRTKRSGTAEEPAEKESKEEK